MKKLTVTALVWLGILFSSAAQQKDEVLVTIGGQPVGLEEFVRIYRKNNENLQNPEDKKSPQAYLDLFVNFKLKVLEAQQLGLDTAQSFRNELAGYRRELAAPYLTDVQLNEQLVQETYRRMTREVNASHILVALPENSSPADTLAAYQRTAEIRRQLLGGVDFNQAAEKWSHDPSAKNNHGNLGWFTVFQMVYPFEEAAYTTPVGEISQPVRSAFGYHLVKVNGAREARGEIKVAHIMKAFPQNATPAQKAAAHRSADSIYVLLQNGANFAELARTLSDDQRSAASGGEMPWFSAAVMIPQFAEPAFALKKNGDVTPPFETSFGFHLLKRLDYRPVPAFAEVKPLLEEKIRRDPERSNHSRERFIEKLKNEYGFRPNTAATETFLNWAPNHLRERHFEIPAGFTGDETLFTLAGQNFTTRQFAGFLQKEIFEADLPVDQQLREKLNRWEEQSIMEYEEQQLERKHPDFKYLLQEYHDGLLLFAISEQKIWQPAAADSAGLLQFYQKNKGKYRWEERFKGLIVKCADPETRNQVDQYFEAGIPVNEILDMVNQSQLRVEITPGAWEKGEDPVVDYYVWNGPKPEELDEVLHFIRGDLAKNEPKTLEEARGFYIADYQKYLEDTWVARLRKKFPVKVNHKLLKTIGNG